MSEAWRQQQPTTLLLRSLYLTLLLSLLPSGGQEYVNESSGAQAQKWILVFIFHFSVGHTATHAVLLARLITKGVDYGIHTFIVQLRSLEDHTPLPGTTTVVDDHKTYVVVIKG